MAGASMGYGPVEGMGPPPDTLSMGGMSPPYDPHAAGPGGSYDPGPAIGHYPSGPVGGTFGGGGDAGSHAGGEEHVAKIDKDTGIAPRRCTDIQCCFVWLVFTVLLLTLMNMSRWYGDVNALTHGRDYYGRICGISQGVENMPWLYWCRDDAPSNLAPERLELSNPSCVAACPVSTDSATQIPCLRPAQSNQQYLPTQQFGNELTQEIEMQESIIYTTPYATRPRGGRFCIPTDPKLELSLLESWEGLHPLGFIMRQVTAGTLGHLEWLFLVTAVVAVLLGYFFYFCIKHCPKTLTTIFILPAAALCFITAVWLFFAIFVLIPGMSDLSWVANYQNKWNPLYQHYTVQVASWLSVGGCLVALIGAVCLIGIDQNFDAASVADLINAGMSCMQHVPGMFWLPIVEAFVKWLIFLFFLNGLRWFYTVGDLHKNRIHVNGARFAGLSRSWDWDMWWVFCVAAWLVGFYWFMEIANAFFEYLISKCTVTYYFTPKDKGKKVLQSNPIVAGLQDAILFHWGSIAYGAFWIPFWRPVRMLYWTMSSIVPGRGNSETFLGKMLGFCECCCAGCKDCCGLKTCSQKMVESPDSIIKDGFSDIVIRANDFGAASQKAHMLLEHSHRVVQYMYRDPSQTTLCVLGVGGISTVCAWVTFMITNFAKPFIEPSSNLYIANPGLVIALSWVLGAYIAFGFMSAWDHTSDTLLYCYAWNRKFSRKTVDTYIPEAVRAIVGFDDKEDDRYPFYGRAKSNMYLRSWITVNDKNDKKKAKEERGPAAPGTPEPSWLAQRSWIGSQPAQAAPPGMEMQSLLARGSQA